MSSTMQADTYYIGWDVGGWNCDRNRDSRDAVVILDSKPALTGTPWRGNLRTIINEATNTREWLEKLFALCDTQLSAEPARIILAIDTPLGFSKAFTRLITRLEEDGQIGQSNTNHTCSGRPRSSCSAMASRPYLPLRT